MRTEICPTHGDFCTSFETQIHITNSDVEVLEQNCLGQGKLALKDGATRLLPIAHLIRLLKDAESKLQGVHAHPRDLTLVGVRTEDAQGLTLFVARKATRQRRLDEDLAEETHAERECAKGLVCRISPLIDRLHERQLSTEQLCTALSAEADPARARAAFVSLASSSDPITDGAKIIHEGTNDQPKRSVQVQGAEIHRVVGRVVSVDQGTRSCRVRLASLPEPSSIFTEKDIGVRVFDVALVEDVGWLLASLAASLSESLEMKLTINAKFDIRGGVNFSATLVGFPDAKKASKRLEAALAESMASLF
ncbi:hypothetical protein [[Acidovorax] ebreus]|uniref:hypothetical protein n=1 Tax=Diaphorobacter sp. LI3 TaxID=2952886 RepID=UPI0020561519|nr:hypothetical protein [Burkholderiales bacterium]UOB06019.1 hypothetical protein MRB47_02570 [Diaphorobacter sp. LI3]